MTTETENMDLSASGCGASELTIKVAFRPHGDKPDISKLRNGEPTWEAFSRFFEKPRWHGPRSHAEFDDADMTDQIIEEHTTDSLADGTEPTI